MASCRGIRPSASLRYRYSSYSWMSNSATECNPAPAAMCSGEESRGYSSIYQSSPRIELVIVHRVLLASSGTFVDVPKARRLFLRGLLRVEPNYWQHNSTMGSVEFARRTIAALGTLTSSTRGHQIQSEHRPAPLKE
jgi:hypothetical protein